MLNNCLNIGLLTESRNCCGCNACVEICPKGCISLVESEEGFFVAKANSKSKECIYCGKCNVVCPVQNSHSEEEKKQYGFIVQNIDEAVRIESTSGGAFSAIALSIVKQKGIVFGATFDEHLNVIHSHVDDEANLYRFRGSKYVQSNLGGGTT